MKGRLASSETASRCPSDEIPERVRVALKPLLADDALVESTALKIQQNMRGFKAFKWKFSQQSSFFDCEERDAPSAFIPGTTGFMAHPRIIALNSRSGALDQDSPSRSSLFCSKILSHWKTLWHQNRPHRRGVGLVTHPIAVSICEVDQAAHFRKPHE